MEQERREHIWQMWLVQLPYMSKDDYIGFDAYFDRVTGRNIDTRPALEILAELDDAEKSMRGGATDGV